MGRPYPPRRAAPGPLGRAWAAAAVLIASCDRGDPRVDPGPQLCLAGEPAPTSRDGVYCGVVDRIDYRFELATTRARASVTLRPVTDAEPCDRIRSIPALDEVTWNDASIAATKDAAGRIAACGPATDGPLTFASDARLVVDPGATGSVGLRRPIDRFDHGFTYLLGWLGSCDLFGACVVESPRLLHFGFEVAHDPTTTVLCPGMRTTDDGVTRCVVDGTRAPTYASYGIVASDAWVRTEWTRAAGVLVEKYEVPEGTAGATIAADTIADYLDWITDLLGPFPYGDTLRVAFVPTTWLGFEHPANLVLSDTVDASTSLYVNPARHTLFHEIAHQWAGDRTTLSDPYEFAWKEAIAEYLAYVYEDEHDPVSSQVTRETWDDSARFAPVYPRPTNAPPLVQVTYSAYGTGPMVLLALETRFGRASVLAGIQHFLSDPTAKSVPDLIASFETVTGASLARFASAYVFGEGDVDWPGFAVTTTEDAGLVTLDVTQQVLAGGPRPAIVTIRLHGASTSTDVRVDFGDAPTSATTSTTVAFAEPVVRVEVDPEARALDAPVLGALVDDEPRVVRPLHP